MVKKKQNNKLELLFKAILFLGCSCFVFQSLLIPGVIWNFGSYGFMIFSVGILILSKIQGINKNLILVATILFSLGIVDLIWWKVQGEKLERGEFETTLKIMTYNLSFRNKNQDLTCEVIKSAAPDILFVQELTPSWSNKLNNSIGNNYPFQEKIVIERSRGIGVFSKFKIEQSKILNNSRNKPYAQFVELYFGDKIVQLINVHLTSPQRALERKSEIISQYHRSYQLRKKELSNINKIAREESEKFDSQILAGDFNTLKYEPIFKKLLKDWVNSFEEVGQGLGFSFPNLKNIKPIVTIDFILLKGKFKCLSSQVLIGGTSDHLAVETRVKI